MFAPSHLAPPPLTTRYIPASQQFSYNDASILLHITSLIRPLLPNAHPDNIAMLVRHMCGSLVRMKRDKQLGPWGILSTEDVFIGIGYKGAECYMGLLVNAPGSVGVACFFEGDRMQINIKMEMHAVDAVEELRRGLVSGIMRRYDELRNYRLAQGR